MSEATATAREIIDRSVVIDTLGGAVVHPTPYVAEGRTRSMCELWLDAMNACLVSVPTYNPTFEEVLAAIYENLLYFEISPKVRHVETVDDLLEAKRRGQLGVFFGLQSGSCLGQDRKRLRRCTRWAARAAAHLHGAQLHRRRLPRTENRGLTHFRHPGGRDCNIWACSSTARTWASRPRSSRAPLGQAIVVSHTAVRAIAVTIRAA